MDRVNVSRRTARRGVCSAGALLAAVAALVCAPAAAAATGGWTQFGFNARHTFANPAETAITAGTVGRLKPGWTASLGADAYLNTTPTVAGGRVFIVDAGGPLVALDAASGARLWATGPGVVGQPAVVGDRVLACQNGVIHAYGVDHGGLRFTAGACTGAPAVDGTRGFSTAGRIVAWSTVDGHRLWRSPSTITLLDQTPTVGYGRVYLGGAYPQNRNMYVFDEATGRLLNTRSAGAGCLSGTPGWLCGYRVMSGTSIVGGNLWFVRFLWCGACADTDGTADLHWFAVTPSAKPPASEELLRNWDELSQYWDPTTPPPVVGNGHVFVPTTESENVEAAYRLVASAADWRAAGVPGTMNATLAPGVAFFDTCGCAVSTATGKVLWSSGSPWALAAPAVVGGVVYWPAYNVLHTYRLAS